MSPGSFLQPLLVDAVPWASRASRRRCAVLWILEGLPAHPAGGPSPSLLATLLAGPKAALGVADNTTRSIFCFFFFSTLLHDKLLGLG